MSTSLSKNHWLKEALCKDQTKLFTSFVPEDVWAAKKICANCPVAKQCLLSTLEVDGLFISAGTSKFDRLNMKWKRATTVGEPSFGTNKEVLSRVLR